MKLANFKLFLLVALLLINTTDLLGQAEYDIAVMGTSKLLAEQIESNYSERLDQLVSSREKESEKHNKERELLAEEIKLKGDFAYVNVHLFQSYGGSLSFIIDVVEKKDVGKRMNFRSVNLQRLYDPDHLIAKWNAYEDLSSELFRKGKIKDMECPVYHCTWSY